MKRNTGVNVAGGIALLMLVALVACRQGSEPAQAQPKPLRVGIAPYQDIAKLTVYKDLKLDQKYGVPLELVTTQWEKIIPSLGSAGPTFDVGFGSLIEFLTKYENINKDTADPLVFVYPAYVFKGGGFVSFNPRVPDLDSQTPPSPESLRRFFSFRLGAQKNSMFDMMLFSLSEQAGIPRSQLHITDTSMTNGLLGAQKGSLDAAAAGLTQRNEALERGGRVVLTMEKFGFADITGLIAKKSTLERRGDDIRKFIHIWFDCVNFVDKDIEKNSAGPIAYLNQQSSTQYTVATYKRALESEYMPRSVAEANDELVSDNGKFSIAKISQRVDVYLVKFGVAKTSPPVPVPIEVKP